MTGTVTYLLVAVAILTLNVLVKAWVNDGRSFIVACPSLQLVSPTVDCTLHIMGSEGVQINVTGTLAGLPKTETISSALLVRITVQGDYSAAQLLIITTSDDVSIFVENQAQGGPSLYLSIALQQDLTQPYTGGPFESFFMAFPITPPEQNVFIVGSAYANTLVTLTIKSTGSFIYDSVTYNDGDTLAVTLQEGEMMQIVTDQDLTGTHLLSTNPIGVFSGTKVQPTLEQIPPLGQWGTTIPLGNYDLCNSITIRVLASQDSTTTDLKSQGGDTQVNLDKGDHYDHVSSLTTLVVSGPILIGIRCSIGQNNHPFAMLLPSTAGLGNEFKCLALSGYNSTVYLSSLLSTDSYYNVSGVETLFTHLDTYSAVSLSTMRASVPDGYLILKPTISTSMEPFIIGFSPGGAYGYACAKGTLGSLLPDAENSLIDVPLAVFTPSPSSSSTVMIESSSDVNIFSSSDPVQETSTFSIEPSSTTAFLTSTETYDAASISIAPSTTIDSSSSSALPSESSTALSTVTVSPDTTTSSLQELCFCRCGDNDLLPNETKAFLQQYDIEIKRNLTLELKTLSSYIRSKTSANDSRPSAQNVGYFGICIICVTLSLLVVADVLNIFKPKHLPKSKSA